MSLLHLSPAVFFAGLAAIAAALYAMQRLRVRHRQLPVVTTLFWKEAVEEARARVFVQRFRHPLAYLLVLSIAALLWFALTDPSIDGENYAEIVVLVDGSAGMGWGNRFEDSVRAMLEQVTAAPRDHLQVLWCAGAVRRLLLPGENAQLLAKRIESLQPQACPASVEEALRGIVLTRDRNRPLHVWVVGDAPIDQETVELLPSDVTVVRVAAGSAVAGRPGNSGIAGLGVTAARSGAWDRVDVFVEVLGGDAEEATLTLNLAGQPLEAKAEIESSPGRQRVVLRDLPARGEILTVALSSTDALAIDNEARIVLPRRPLIRVALSESLEPILGPVLAADPAVILAADDPTVVVRRRGEPIGAGVPALEFVPAEDQEDAILLHHERDLVSRDVLLDSFNRLGLEEIDAVDLASSANVEISVGATPADLRAVLVWDALLGEEFNFVYSRSFPLFVARALRWLVDYQKFPSRVVVGEELSSSQAFEGPDGRLYDPAGAHFRPPLAGQYRDAAGAVVAASLLDPWVSLGGSDTLESVSSSGVAGGASPFATVLIVLVLGLLMLEWVLFRSGRIP